MVSLTSRTQPRITPITLVPVAEALAPVDGADADGIGVEGDGGPDSPPEDAAAGIALGCPVPEQPDPLLPDGPDPEAPEPGRNCMLCSYGASHRNGNAN